MIFPYLKSPLYGIDFSINRLKVVLAKEGFGRFNREKDANKDKDNEKEGQSEAQKKSSEEKQGEKSKPTEADVNDKKKSDQSENSFFFNSGKNQSGKGNKGPIFKPPSAPKADRSLWIKLGLGAAFLCYMFVDLDLNNNTVDLSYMVISFSSAIRRASASK